MQDDGNLVLYDANSQVHWPSGTGRNWLLNVKRRYNFWFRNINK